MDPNALRIELVKRVCRLPAESLLQADVALRALEAPPRDMVPEKSPLNEHREWPHAPLHRLTENGTYMVTTGTYLKEHHFRDAARLRCLEHSLLRLANEYEWHLEAWAIFSNHYHFVGYTHRSP